MSVDLQPGSQPAALRVRGLRKRFGTRIALDDVDLEIGPGEAFGLVGANGAGKTTLIKCVLDLCAASAGRIDIVGVAHRQPASRRALSYLPERFTPPHYLLGREFLETTAAIAGATFQLPRAERLLAELELDRSALERPVRQLSKGMTQKLGLAACLQSERRLYLLDEPMSGLDPASRVAVKSILSRLRDAGRTLFFTSHVLADVEELCSSVAVIDRGRVRFRGTPAGLCQCYGEPNLERAFLKCITSAASGTENGGGGDKRDVSEPAAGA
jgi:ABC-2 type transport system ATP-binding protein